LLIIIKKNKSILFQKLNYIYIFGIIIKYIRFIIIIFVFLIKFKKKQIKKFNKKIRFKIVIKTEILIKI
jgi:hypothetical protein